MPEIVRIFIIEMGLICPILARPNPSSVQQPPISGSSHCTASNFRTESVELGLWLSGASEDVSAPRGLDILVELIIPNTEY
jgi:hypothetical protein